MIEIEENSTSPNFRIDTDDSPVGAVIEFLNSNLPTFPVAFQRLDEASDINAEDKVSQELYTFLQRIAWGGVFMFQFQRLEADSQRSSDFGVLTVENYDPSSPSRAFFLIEAKRLPTPGTGRQKEYVEGTYGGIERYKRGYHGSHLRESGSLIGYIQDDNDCNHWLGEINAWISDLIATRTEGIIWSADDRLENEETLQKIRKYESVNSRVAPLASDPIKLHHYLVPLDRIKAKHGKRK